MRRALASSLAVLLALAPTAASAGVRPCRLPVRAAASGSPCGAPPERPAAPVDPTYKQPTGLPQLVVGASLFAFGIPTTIVGSLLTMSPGDASDRPRPLGQHAGLYFLIPGALMMLLGMPLTALGAVRYERFRRENSDWTARVRVRPSAGGFALRF